MFDCQENDEKYPFNTKLFFNPSVMLLNSSKSNLFKWKVLFSFNAYRKNKIIVKNAGIKFNISLIGLSIN
jgi:hypothetical protein